MSHYKPYPAYKDSGVEWLGHVPEHWEVKPIKIIASCNDDSLPESIPSDMPIRYVDISAVSHDEGISGAEPMAFGDAPSRARRKAKVGDVVMSTVRTYLKAVASVDEAHADCVYSTGFAVLRARSGQLAPEFLKWLALNDLLIQAIESHSEGLSYPAINASELVNLKTVVPGLHEQRRIASALDRETARIDALIAKKTEFIELLAKKRQALITHAVTKGLDPNVKMKDSGVEWIGGVPEGWEVARIKRKAQIATDRCSTIPEGFTYIGLEDVESGSGQYKPTATTSRQSDDSTVGLFQKGDVLYGKLRPYLRKCITGPFDGACSTEFLVLKPSSLSARWLQNWLLTNEVTQQIEAGCDGAKMPRTDWEHVGSIPIPVPHWAEQDAIVSFLDRETARIDILIEKVQLSIDLLKKRRSALITAAVTGQIDLRESA
jgi:type I restriction enzyme S subunit